MKILDNDSVVDPVYISVLASVAALVRSFTKEQL